MYLCCIWLVVVVVKEEEEEKETDFSFSFSLELRSLTHRHCRSSIPSSVRERASPLVKHVSSFLFLSLCLMMSIIDSGCLPFRIIPERICSSSSLFLFIYIYIYIFVCDCVCVCGPSAMENMEVSMSFVYLKRNRRVNEGCFVCKTFSVCRYRVKWPPCRGYQWQLYNTNYDIISFIHFVSFADLFGKAYSSTTIEHLSHYFKQNEKEKEQFLIVLVRLSVLEQVDEEDSRGNTWYFMLRSSQVFKIIR